MDHKPRSKNALEELRGDKTRLAPLIPIVQAETPQESGFHNFPLTLLSGRNIVTRTDPELVQKDTIYAPVSEPVQVDGTQGSESDRITTSTHNQVVPHRSGRVVNPPDRYIFLGESYNRISDELDTEPSNYNEVLQDKDTTL